MCREKKERGNDVIILKFQKKKDNHTRYILFCKCRMAHDACNSLTLDQESSRVRQIQPHNLILVTTNAGMWRGALENDPASL